MKTLQEAGALCEYLENLQNRYIAENRLDEAKKLDKEITAAHEEYKTIRKGRK
jgi:hypothetical protein